jgi:hypothetical protein
MPTIAACTFAGAGQPAAPQTATPVAIQCQASTTKIMAPARASSLDHPTRIEFVSGSDWDSFYGDPSGRAEASAGRAVEVSAGASNLPNARWIWRGGTNPEGPADMQIAVFEKAFTLGPHPVGTISIAVDDFVEVVVNGNALGCSGSTADVGTAFRGQSAPASFEMSPYLHEGLNKLSIVAQNGPAAFAGCPTPCTYQRNHAGVVFSGVLSY